MSTQRARLLAAFKAAGRTGLTVVDAHRLDPPVLSLTGRMADLRAEGYEFVRGGRRHRCQVWILAQARSGPQAPHPTTSPQEGARAASDGPSPCGDRVRTPLPGLATSHYAQEVR